MKKLSKLTQSIRHLFTMLCGAILFFICPRLMLNHQKKWAPFVQWDYAHRGLHDNLWGVPENSLPAFQAAMDKGYGIELDVHLTADNELVVHHDDTLYRMCHVERDIKDMTLKEIRQYTLLGTEEKIPTLQEVLDLVNGRVPLLIELKTESHTCIYDYRSRLQLFVPSGLYILQIHRLQKPDGPHQLSSLSGTSGALDHQHYRCLRRCSKQRRYDHI